MTRSLFACRFAAGFSVCFAGPLAAAPLPTPDAVAQAEPSSASVSGLTPAKACLSDLSAFDSQMEKEGYWPGGAGFGYGYPMDGVAMSDFQKVGALTSSLHCRCGPERACFPPLRHANGSCSRTTAPLDARQCGSIGRRSSVVHRSLRSTEIPQR